MNPPNTPRHAPLSVFASHCCRLEVIHDFHGFSDRCPLSSASWAQPPTLELHLHVSDSVPLSSDDPESSDNSDCIDSEPEDVASNVLTLLSRAINNLAQSADRSTSVSSHRTRVRIPDRFDGSDPQKLRTFLVQCELNFQDHPRAFCQDRAKVTFAQSYLTGMALGWFEPDLLLADTPDLRPLWMEDYQDFIRELRTNFSAPEHELHHLSFTDGQHVNKYVVRFNHLAS